MPDLVAFRNDPTIKAFYLNRVRAHARADEIQHGFYWEGGKGCAVGCTLHSSKHAAYETELGIPQVLAKLEDRLFEGMKNGRAKSFPEQFLLAAKVGADLSRVGWKFLHWLLTEELTSRDDPRVAAQIKRCADVLVPLTKGEAADKKEAADAANAAVYAADAAANAAAYAADAANAANAAANAANAAAYAADAAANAAAYAANSAVYAADAAANAAAYAAAHAAYAADAANAANAAAYAAAHAAYAARSSCYERMADKLLLLMAECEGEPLRVGTGQVG